MRQVKARRKSVDSSSSSSSDCSERHGKGKERREERKRKRELKREERKREKSGHGCDARSDTHTQHQMMQGGQPNSGYPQVYRAGGESEQSAPPPYVPQNPVPPSSGYRIPLTTQMAFPLEPRQTGPPAFFDADGVSPIFIGSALMEGSVHPCKIGPRLNPFASVPYGGGEYGHYGRFDLLPFRHDQMEWVHTSGGRIPSGRRPIEGGYEESGHKLYHAAAVVNGIKVPGKAGVHLCVFFSYVFVFRNQLGWCSVLAPEFPLEVSSMKSMMTMKFCKVYFWTSLLVVLM